MLTKVFFDGLLGKKFGKQWDLDVSNANEALRMVEANKPGLLAWIRDNLAIYSHYRVRCVYTDGREEDLDDDTYTINRKPAEIHFSPVIEGAGGLGQMVMGALLIAVAVFVPGAQFLMGPGISMLLGGAIAALSSSPAQSITSQAARSDKTSYFFDGPVNTTMQGVPVPLIWGFGVLVGSHAISANLSVDQLL